MAIDPEFLDLLVCPQCRGKDPQAAERPPRKLTPTHDEKGEGLRCEVCRLLYRLEDGIPQMLSDEAQKL